CPYDEWIQKGSTYKLCTKSLLGFREQAKISIVYKDGAFQEAHDIILLLEVTFKFDISALIDKLNALRVRYSMIRSWTYRPGRKCANTVAAPGRKLLDVR